MRDEYLSKSAARRRSMLDSALLLFGWRCAICGGPIAQGDESLQHMKPRSKGGTDDMDNLRPAHKRCNSALRDNELDTGQVVFGGEAWLIEHMRPPKK